MAKPKLQLSAREVVTDLRSGMTDLELMRKYELSPKGLQSLFGKLVAKRIIEQEELDSRKSPVRPLDKEKQSQSAKGESASGQSGSFRCPSCGLEQPEGSVNCPRCGIHHREAAEQPMQTAPGPAPTTGPPPRGAVEPAPSHITTPGHMPGVSSRVGPSPMEPAMIFGVIGSALLLLGCLSPVVRLSVVGLNLFSLGQLSMHAQIGGYLLVALAVAGLVLSLAGRYRHLWKCGATASLFLLVALVTFWSKMAAAKAGMAQGVSKFQAQVPHGPANPAMEQFATAMAKVMQVQIGLGWGWVPLFAGATMLVVASFLAPRDS